MPPIETRPRRGRPTKPYGIRDHVGSEEWAHRVLLFGPHTGQCDAKQYIRNDPHLVGGRLGSDCHPATVATAISQLIEAADRPLSRLCIETSLETAFGVPPATTTTALAMLRRKGKVVLAEFRVSGRSRTAHFYGLREATAREQSAIRRLLSLQVQVFDENRHVIGYAAESYVYGVLRLSDSFTMMPKRMLGNIWDTARKRKLDIRVVSKVTGEPIGVSVRNWREFMYPWSRHFAELRDLEQAFGHRVALVASHLSESAKKQLPALGFSSYELRRRVLPSELSDGRHVRLLLQQLRPITGPIRAELVPTDGRFPRRHQYTDALRRDLHELPEALTRPEQ